MDRLKTIKAIETKFVKIDNQNNTILVEVSFKNKTGDDRFWYPQYSDLAAILSHLVALYGKEEVITELFKEGYTQVCEDSLKKIKG